MSGFPLNNNNNNNKLINEAGSLCQHLSQHLSFETLYGQQTKSNAEFYVIREKSV